MLTAPSEPSGIPRLTQISRKAYQCLGRWPAWHPRFSSRPPSPLSSHICTQQLDDACFRSYGSRARRRGGRRPLLRWPVSHTHTHTHTYAVVPPSRAPTRVAAWPCNLTAGSLWRRDAPIDYVFCAELRGCETWRSESVVLSL
jgi:hypothetical protein